MEKFPFASENCTIRVNIGFFAAVRRANEIQIYTFFLPILNNQFIVFFICFLLCFHEIHKL